MGKLSGVFTCQLLFGALLIADGLGLVTKNIDNALMMLFCTWMICLTIAKCSKD
ncbi:hypothetical protein D3C77_28320 [compost metagenome]